MIYYGCSIAELENETCRRGFRPAGNCDSLSEGLKVLDDTQGSEATTVQTVTLSGPYNPMEEYTTLCRCAGNGLKMVRAQRPRSAFGKTVDASLLIGEKIVYWTMNTFSPIVQLFFESGLSCTIEGGQLANAVIGMDNKLHARLTDLMHKENAQFFNTILPAKFRGAKPAIKLVEARVAHRTSIAVKQLEPQPHQNPSLPKATILYETHMVVGLRLDGMREMGYVWARDPHKIVSVGEITWGNVRIAGLVDDVVASFLGLPQVTKPGGQTKVVEGGSLIRATKQ